MTSNTQSNIDKLIKLYFNQPKVLYEHLFSSYHQFISEIIPYSLIQEKNYFYEDVDKEMVYLHGFKCSNIRIKPSTFENDNEIKFPSDARKNHLNYFATIVADIQQFVEILNSITGEKTIKLLGNVEKETPVANVPIMVKSKYCSTYIKQDLKGECKYDPGGYFIVNGSEKIVMSIEKMVDNKILVFTKKDPSYESGLIYTAQINSRRNDWSDNLQILTIKTRKDGVFTVSTSSQLVDVPLFILMRALGVEADQNIIGHITYDLEDTKMLNIIRPSVAFSNDDEGNPIRTKEEAVEYLITKLKRNKRISLTDEKVAYVQKKMYLDKILRQDLLPHLGEDIPKKIAFLGFMANRLINVMLGRQDVDDRDALQNKRIETPGILLGQLFRQNWKKMLNEIGKHFKKKNQSNETPINVVAQIKPSIIEQGLKTALATGVWGINKTKNGVAQSLQRLSWIQGISYLRRVLSPSMDESTAKVTSIRHVNNNQMQLLCCLTGDAEILMGNNMDCKRIKDIVDGELVMTVNPYTLKLNPSTMYNKFSRMADKLFEIKTTSGRIIKATPEHPFLIDVNGIPTWKRVDELTTNDRMIINHTLKMIDNTSDYQLKLNENEISKDYYLELYNAGLVGKPIQESKLLSITRLCGLITANTLCYDSNLYGWIENNNNSYDLFIKFIDNNNIFDVNSINNDILNIGLGSPTYNEINILNNTLIIRKSGALAYLLYILCKSSNMVPDWIMDSNELIKREYLSVIQSKSGNSLLIKSHNNSLSYSDYVLIDKSKYINIDNIIHTVPEDDLNITVKMMAQLSKLYNDLNIKTSVKIKQYNSIQFKNKIHDVIIQFNNTSAYIETFVDTIGFRYDINKTKLSAKAIECIKLYNNNQDINDAKVMDNNLVSVSIQSIKEIDPELIYDFTTHSDNHSFVASSIVSSNCSETPEGQKIGIVKSLAMMAGITSQNLTQIDVVKSVLAKNKFIKHPYDVDPLQMNSYVKIMINGDWIGVTKLTHANDIYSMLKTKRRENIIDKQTSILFDFRNKEIRIYFDGGRLIRPLLVVNNNNLNITPQVVEDLNTHVNAKDKTKSWKDIISKYPNLVEYEDIESLNYLLVAESEQRLVDANTAKTNKVEYTDTTKINRYGDFRWVNYTHCDFHAWVMLGTVVGNIPFSNHNYANRNIIHFSQAKQSISVYLSSYKDRMDISQVLWHPQVPLVQTQAMQYNHCLDLPHGENAVVAVCSYSG